MCGIVGFINKSENKKEVIKEMADKIIHRGPDQGGYYIDENIALGHRRLSIIDINNGKQPMISQDKRYVLIFNGEIYNFEELKNELIKENYYFLTNSDTEVLFVAYISWGGDRVLEKLRGMFAFAIWDKEMKTLFCARDHFGIKPFYFYHHDEVFMFASEIKAFLPHPQFHKVFNQKLIGPYLSFSFTPTNETFFKDVYCLDPGTSLTWQNNKITIQRYHSPEFQEKDQTLEKSIFMIDEVMKNSIDHHLISDCEVGAFLSSGVDSSYLVSLSKLKKTYTVGYRLQQYSEIDYANELTKELGIKNKSYKIEKQEYLKAISSVIYHLDEPIADPSAISLYFLAKLASQDIKVIISGEGADEFFGGYNYYMITQNDSFYHKTPYFIRHQIAGLCCFLPEFKGRNFLIRAGNQLENNYIGVNKIWSERERKKVLKVKDILKNNDITRPVFNHYQNENSLNQMQAIDIHFWLLKDILLKVDKMTMAHSIEARTPFVDKQVFAVASTLSKDHKVSNKQTKIALRLAAKKVIPNKAYKKKKLGFPVPLREWMKEDDFYNEIKSALNQDFVQEFFDQKYLLHLLEQHKNNKKDNYRKIWSVYSLIKWYEIFFKG